MAFTKKFKLRGNYPQINKPKTELTKLVNQGGDNSEEILRVEEKIQLLVDEDLTKALQAKQENVDDSSEAIQDFLNSGNDTMPLSLIHI